MAENSEIPTIGALKYTRELPIKESSNAGNLIWTFNSSFGGVLAFASIWEIARYDSEIARISLAGSTQMGSVENTYCKKKYKYSNTTKISRFKNKDIVC